MLNKQKQIGLFGKLDKAKKGTEDYDDAKKSILDKYGEYLKGLGDEKNALDDVARAYGAVSAAAKQAALIELLRILILQLKKIGRINRVNLLEIWRKLFEIRISSETRKALKGRLLQLCR